MIEYFNKKLEQLVDAILEPYWNRFLGWVRSLSLLKLVSVASVLVIFLAIALYWRSLPVLIDGAYRGVRVGISRSTLIPVNSGLTTKLEETSKRLSESIQSDLSNPRNINPESAWTFAQDLAAGNQLTKFDRRMVIDYLRAISKKNCNCWQETPAYADPPHIPATGWVFFALAEIGEGATDSEIRFLLDEQHRDGWWSLFPVHQNSQYASTFGTAWAILGLQHQLSKKLIPEPLSKEVKEAISKAAFWLTGHKESEITRWKDYPLLARGKVSESISGLVIHALHLTLPESIRLLEKSWLDETPLSPPSAGDGESNFFWIETRNDRTQNDKFVQIKLPWLLIATVDAYGSGDLLQRVRALGWIEKALDQKTVVHAEQQPDNWWRAELLLAIQYVLNHARFAKY